MDAIQRVEALRALLVSRASEARNDDDALQAASIVYGYCADLLDAFRDQQSGAGGELQIALDTARRGTRFPRVASDRGTGPCPHAVPYIDPDSLYAIASWPWRPTQGDVDADYYSRVVIVKLDPTGTSIDAAAPILSDTAVREWGPFYDRAHEPNGQPFADEQEATQYLKGGLGPYGRAISWFAHLFASPVLMADDYAGKNSTYGDYPGAAEIGAAMVPVVAASPTLASALVRQDTGGDRPRASLFGLRIAVVDGCTLMGSMRTALGTYVARRVAPLGVMSSAATLSGAPTLADLALRAALGTMPEEALAPTTLPEGVRGRAAFGIWEQVCAAEPDPITGRLPNADRLLDVARALGIDPDAHQARSPESLCTDLAEAAVRAASFETYGVDPLPMPLPHNGDSRSQPPVLGLFRPAWYDSNVPAGDPTDPFSARWSKVCTLGGRNDYIPADRIPLLLQFIDDVSLDARGQSITSAIDGEVVVRESERAAAAGLGRPLSLQRGDDAPRERSYGEFGQPTLYDVAALVARLTDSGVPIDPLDIVHPARLCGRFALWSLNTST